MENKVYVAKLSDNNECFLKVGVTNNFTKRKYFFRKIGYKIELLFLSNNMILKDAFHLEKQIKNKNKKEHYIPEKKFGGYTECFKSIEL